MTDVLEPTYGYPPWQPAPGAELVAEWDRLDVPTYGVVTVFGQAFVFRCIDGHNAPLSLWVYVPIPSEAAPGASADEAFLGWVHRVGFVSFALADQDFSIIRGAVKLEVPEDRSLLQVAASALSLSDDEREIMGVTERELA